MRRRILSERKKGTFGILASELALTARRLFLKEIIDYIHTKESPGSVGRVLAAG